MSAPTVHGPRTAGTVDAVVRARDAAAREAWAEAYALLHAHDRHPSRGLTAGDLTVLADAAWWTGHVEESVTARLRSHAAHVAADDHRGAGLASWRLAEEYRGLGRPAAAAGWLHRARHHLEDLPDCPEQCFLAWTAAEEAEARGDPGAALAAARRMTEQALRSGSPDLLALSLQAESGALLTAGRRTEALALLDEAMRRVAAGELSGMFTGRLYELALTRCMETAALDRAVEWTNAAMEWCAPPWSGRRTAEEPRGAEPAPERAAPAPGLMAPGLMDPGPTADGLPADDRATGGLPADAPVPPMAVPAGENPFRGVCRARRAEVLDLLGAWALAEAEARQACREVPVDRLEAAAAACYTAGEVQRRQGRTDAAAVSYGHAHGLGRVPQPGLALLRLAQGRTDAAVAGVELALAHHGTGGRDLLGRARLLAARTEIALAVGDPAGAAEAAAALDALAGDVQLPRALADTALGSVAPAGEARDVLRRALAGWRELRVPYEAARVRTLLAVAHRERGDEAEARRELGTARALFERLGAVPDARRATMLAAAGAVRR
ncbi:MULTISPECIES: LuxR family transcriptional regulator [unclassified Streptomyces]|uniref:LuxR family transcriptional regulator n=1 Tax=unclassified Streptomyces TaxID=2593676 RepID=UPI000A4094DD|nr:MULTISPECIES: LuxR family transcriptional regulator [unclassified Streptomyces]